MTTLNNNKYIESQNIKVFPCAYRGYYNSSTTPATTLVFDPEARATTEANFTNTFHKLSDNKESYVVAWVPASTKSGFGTLKCVIGGYYFEIYDHQISDFFDSGNPCYLCIKTEQVSLGTSALDESDARATEVLSSFDDKESTNYLDVKNNEGKYVFTGLIVSTTDTGTASLIPFMQGTSFFKINTEPTDKIGKYYSTTDTDALTEITSENVDKIPTNAQFYIKYETYKVKSTALPVTSLLDVGGGSYSLRMIEDITEHGTNTTVASGNYSVALGRSTAATGEASTALGNNTEASAEGAFAAGNNTKASKEGAVALGSNTTALGLNATALGDTTTASGKNSLALGSNTKAEADNQVVIGTYNEKDDNQAFIIANGNATTKSNKFTVSKTGNVKALGTLETKGSIKATGNSNNDLELGTAAAGSSGSIKVYGMAATPVFSVENSGNATIAGTTAISGDTSIAGLTRITKDTQSNGTTSGALKVAGGVGIAKNLNVGGTTNIMGKTTLENTLTVNGDNATTLGGTLTVTGATTLNNNLVIKGNNIASIGGNTTIGGTLAVTGGTTLGENLIVDGSAKINNDTDYSKADGETINAALDVAGGVHIAKKLNVGDSTTIQSTVNATSPTTGALVVSGGAGFGNDIYINGTIHAAGLDFNLSGADSGSSATNDALTFKKATITSPDDYSKDTSTNNVDAALKVMGGMYVAKKLHVGGDTTFYDNLEIGANLIRIKKDTSSTAANNGALAVVGGVGIGKELNVAGNAKFTKDLVIAGSQNTPNSLQIGNESTSNKGGELLIYGTGTDTIFEVDNKGNTTLDGTLIVGNELKVSKKLTVDGSVEISSAGIDGLSGLTVAGQINAATFNATSDARLKSNIEDYKCKKSILDLPIKSFEYTNDKNHTKYIGCIAQDLQEICPEIITTNKEGFLSIQETKLIYLLLQEVKELKEKVDQLERR